MKFQIGTSSLHHSSNVQSQIGTCLNKKMDDIAIIENKIYEIRGQKVMLDFDLAEMYGVETKRLKEQVRRNIERFPAEFMFELTKEEVAISKRFIFICPQIFMKKKILNMIMKFRTEIPRRICGEFFIILLQHLFAALRLHKWLSRLSQ